MGMGRYDNAHHRMRKNNGNGCYIATSVYGSYDCPQVWTLRRYRDDVLDKTIFGRLFIRIYYKLSPILVRTLGSTKLFKSFFKRFLDKQVTKLHKLGFSDKPYIDKDYN